MAARESRTGDACCSIGQGRHRPRPRFGFTLVELLVVVSIIALLIAILMPSFRSARDQTQATVCRTQLGQIGMALFMYADDNRQELPHYNTIGRHSFRMAPRKRSSPSAPEESWGLQSVLQAGRAPTILPNGLAYPLSVSKPVYLAGDSKVWICPANPGPSGYEQQWASWGNTYSYQCNSRIEYNIDRIRLAKPKRRPDGTISNKIPGGHRTPLVWDNHLMLPGDSGMMGPFRPGYTIREQDQRAPHRSGRFRKRGPGSYWIALYADGHTEFNGITNINH